MPEDSLASLASDFEYLLAMAIGKRLIDKFTPTVGADSNRFAVAVLNYAFLKETEDLNAQRYREQHHSLIVWAAQQVPNDEEMSDAFSLLYSLMLIRIGPTDFDRSHRLAERATELCIELRTPEEICGTSDPSVYLDYVRKYAQRLLNREAAI